MMWAATPFASAASWGEVRNDWPITETCGAAPSCFTISQTMSEPCSRLPASITAMVSTKASRARSMPSGGTFAMSKPTTKSAMMSESRRPEPAGFSSALAADATGFASCANADVAATPSAPAPPSKSRRSISCCMSSSRSLSFRASRRAVGWVEPLAKPIISPRTPSYGGSREVMGFARAQPILPASVTRGSAWPILSRIARRTRRRLDPRNPAAYGFSSSAHRQAFRQTAAPFIITGKTPCASHIMRPCSRRASR